MATIEERVAYLEGQVSEHTQTLIDRRFGEFEDRLELRFDRLEDKMSRHFTWLVGIQVTTLVAIVGALLARS